METYSEANGAHDGHGEEVQPGVSQPEAKARAAAHAVGLADVAATGAGGGSSGGMLAGSAFSASEEAHLGGSDLDPQRGELRLVVAGRRFATRT